MRKGLAVLLAAVMLLSFSACREETKPAATEDRLVTVYLLTERVCGEEKAVYTYNEFGEKTRAIEYWGEKENDSTTYEYTYDESGRVTKKIYYYAGQTVNPSWVEYTYDAQGNRTAWVEAYERADYIYDSNGNVTELVKYDSQGKETSRRQYIYDENGKLTQVVYRQGHYWIYAYDESGKLILITAYYEDIAYGQTEFVYDSQGNLVKAVAASEGSAEETLTYTKLQISWSRAKYLALDPGVPDVVIIE